ncbi:hypothetical protein ILYODFUR_010709 [Ilyodon furcidens]|uniref:Uncharacterized protein n=1 Tax=Ilyodon furcidens TaxID=33524 RepID=A0ABV0U4B0_9TELE
MSGVIQSSHRKQQQSIKESQCGGCVVLRRTLCMCELLFFCEQLHVQTSMDKWLTESDAFIPNQLMHLWLHMWNQEHISVPLYGCFPLSPMGTLDFPANLLPAVRPKLMN